MADPHDITARLQPGERVLWQGRPDPRPDPAFNLYRPVSPGGKVVLGLLLGLLPLFMLVQVWPVASRSLLAAAPVLLLVGLLWLGLWYLVFGGKARVDAWGRRRAAYHLTDRRAIVTSTAFGIARMQSWPAADWNALHHDGREPGTIVFRRVRAGRNPRNQHVYGFAGIREAARVFALMQGVLARRPPVDSPRTPGL